MADLAPTSISIGSQSTRKIDVQFGESVTGVTAAVVYKNTQDGKYYLGDNNDTVAKATSAGLVLSNGIADAWGIIVTSGPVILGGVTLTLTDVIFLSATLGKMMPDADLATGHYVSQIGMPTATNVLDVSIKNYLHQIP